MTPDELARWEAANRLASTPAARACYDCMDWWAEAMRAVGRCNGEPGEPVLAPRRGRSVTRREANRLAAQRWRDRQRAMLVSARAG
jgi:hypothetical protein